MNATPSIFSSFREEALHEEEPVFDRAEPSEDDLAEIDQARIDDVVDDLIQALFGADDPVSEPYITGSVGVAPDILTASIVDPNRDTEVTFAIFRDSLDPEDPDEVLVAEILDNVIEALGIVIFYAYEKATSKLGEQE